MEFRPRSGLGVTSPQQPPGTPFNPQGLYYLPPQVSPSSGVYKPLGSECRPQLHQSNLAPRTCATVQPSSTKRPEDNDGPHLGFAVALRNLAKNASISSSTELPGGSDDVKLLKSTQNAILDVRKGFDRRDNNMSIVPTEPAQKKSVSSSTVSSCPKPIPDIGGGGFQPYRATVTSSGDSIVSNRSHSSSSNFIASNLSYPIFGGHQCTPYPSGYEPVSLYHAQYERYMAELAHSSSISLSAGYAPSSSSFSPQADIFPTSHNSPTNVSEYPNDRSKSETPDPISASKRKESLLEHENPPKKCIFARPFEDNYSSITKDKKSLSLLKDPVPSSVSFHPSSSELMTSVSSSLASSTDKSVPNSEILSNKKPKTAKKTTKPSLRRKEKKDAKKAIHSDKKTRNPLSLELPPRKSTAEKHKISSSKEKSRHLKRFQLVSQRNKNDCKKSVTMKRDHPQRNERSPSPPYIDINELNLHNRSTSPTLPLPSIAPHLNGMVESYAQCMYMNAIGLTRVSSDSRQEKEEIWNTILNDRLFKNSCDVTTKYFVRLRNMSPITNIKESVGFFFHPSSKQISKISRTCITSKSNVHHKNSLPRLPIDLATLVPVSKSMLEEVISTEPVPKIVMNSRIPPPTTVVNSSTSSWPGVEGIIESYKKHRNERESEIKKLGQVLICLNDTGTKKRAQVDSLSMQMSFLVREQTALNAKNNSIRNDIQRILNVLTALKKS